ncbi:MAG: hypothetical protein OXF19_07560, partial [Hyphomicrobiales bacterium]|nr:hypothetical protein [Hyphomicrobiales bacterium]
MPTAAKINKQTEKKAIRRTKRSNVLVNIFHNFPFKTLSIRKRLARPDPAVSATRAFYSRLENNPSP